MKLFPSWTRHQNWPIVFVGLLLFIGTLWVVLPAASGGCVYSTQWSCGYTWGDEEFGFVLTALVYHGRVPYRDFFHIYAPIGLYLPSVFYALLGESLAIRRFYMAFMASPMATLLIYGLAHQVFENLLISATLALSYFAGINGMQDRTFFGFLAILFFIIYIDKPVDFMGFITGLAAGVAILASQEVGVLALVIIGLALLLWPLHPISDSLRLRLKSLAVLGLGWSIPVISAIVFFAARGGLNAALYDLFLYVFTTYQRLFPLPMALLSPAALTFYLFTIVTYVAMFSVLAIEGILQPPSPLQKKLAVLLLFEIALFTTATTRADLGHLFFAIPLLPFFLYSLFRYGVHSFRSLLVASRVPVTVEVSPTAKLLPFAILFNIGLWLLVWQNPKAILAIVLLDAGFLAYVWQSSRSSSPSRLATRCFNIMPYFTSLGSLLILIFTGTVLVRMEYPYALQRVFPLQPQWSARVSGVLVPTEVANTTQRIVDGLRERTQPGQAIFMFPYHTLFYLLSDRHNATGYYFFHWSVVGRQYLDQEEETVLTELKHMAPAMVGIQLQAARNIGGRVYYYLLDHYEPVADIPYLGNTIRLLAPSLVSTRSELYIADYVANFHFAQAPPIYEERNYLRADAYEINGQTRDVIWQHPPYASTMSLRLCLPAHSKLKVGLGPRPSTWQPELTSSGENRIILLNRSGAHVLFTKYLDPVTWPEDRMWHEAVIDLGDFRGVVTLRFETDSAHGIGWAEPVIMLAHPMKNVSRLVTQPDRCLP